MPSVRSAKVAGTLRVPSARSPWLRNSPAAETAGRTARGACLLLFLAALLPRSSPFPNQPFGRPFEPRAAEGLALKALGGEQLEPVPSRRPGIAAPGLVKSTRQWGEKNAILLPRVIVTQASNKKTSGLVPGARRASLYCKGDNNLTDRRCFSSSEARAPCGARQVYRPPQSA